MLSVSKIRSQSWLLGFDIQRAGEVIEDDEFGFTDEHARRGGALHLSTRKFYAARADHRFEVVVQLFEVTIHDGEFCGFIDFIVAAVETKQNIISQGVAEQARHLCGVGTARRDEKISRRCKSCFRSSGSRLIPAAAIQAVPARVLFCQNRCAL